MIVKMYDDNRLHTWIRLTHFRFSATGFAASLSDSSSTELKSTNNMIEEMVVAMKARARKQCLFLNFLLPPNSLLNNHPCAPKISVTIAHEN